MYFCSGLNVYKLSIKKQCLGVCDVCCVCTYVWMCSPMRVHGHARRWPQGVFFYYCPSLFLTQDLQLNLELPIWLNWLVSALAWHISVPSLSTEVTGACCHTCLFRRVLRIRAQVFMLSQEAVHPLSRLWGLRWGFIRFLIDSNSWLPLQCIL